MDTSYAIFIETMVPQQELIVSRTNLSGIITYVNDTFATISGYEVDELIGKTHSIVRHPDMPKSIFGDLWQTLKRGDGWQGIIKNKRKDDGYYWVYADISGVYKEGKLVEYKSLRTPIDRQTKIKMQNYYDDLRKREEKSSRVVMYVSDEQLEKLLQFIH
jgi:aerotaxis receptor